MNRYIESLKLRRFELAVIEVGIETVCGQKLVVRSAFDYIAVFHYQNQILTLELIHLIIL